MISDVTSRVSQETVMKTRLQLPLEQRLDNLIM
jgi:hypothetical protein